MPKIFRGYGHTKHQAALRLDRTLALSATKTRVEAGARMAAAPEVKNPPNRELPQSTVPRRDCVTNYPTNLINPRERSAFEMQEASTLTHRAAISVACVRVRQQ